MLRTMSQYPKSSISLKFSDSNNVHVMNVSYERRLFLITYTDSRKEETYGDVESTIFAINNEVNK
ncbi:hypothetical protein [Bacillus marinisedimentorum]|uniref:hypothetical protein n=1 Tax=Bacillus marinisedimentorum TaxID=1821260 RepID=UPI001B802AB9|nr:hypothetical protein [Bacillus marinisedimentorum]